MAKCLDRLDTSEEEVEVTPEPEETSGKGAKGRKPAKKPVQRRNVCH